MASTLLQAEPFVKIIHQQLEILKDGRNTVTDAVDHQINKVQSDVNVWINGGIINHTTYTEINNIIQETLSLFLDKAVELSVKQTTKNESDLNNKTSNSVTSLGACSNVKETREEPLLGSYETLHNLGKSAGSEASHNMKMRFSILEEAVYSLKKTTEKVEDKIENVDKILKDVSTQQVNDHKKMEILTNAKSKSEKKLKDKITQQEKRYQDISSNLDDLFETVSNVDVKLNRLEEENKSVNVSMNELNEQISSVRTCSNDTLKSMQDLSKSVESTNQHYNEMSNKMNLLEISINLMSSQCTEQFDNMSSHIKDQADDLIGMVCQLLAKRLTPLEKLNETLSKKVNSGDKQLSERDTIENRVAEMSNKITEIEFKCIPPKVRFRVTKMYLQGEDFGTIISYDHVNGNNGNNFDLSTGTYTAPLNGLYLITIMTKSSSTSKINTFNCYRNGKNKLHQRMFAHNVSINQTATRCVEIADDEQLYLHWETIDEHDTTQITVVFSCHLIHKL